MKTVAANFYKRVGLLSLIMINPYILLTKIFNQPRLIILQVLLLLMGNMAYGQSKSIAASIDSLLNAKSSKPFNGNIIITENGLVTYSNMQGYSNLESKTVFNPDDEFVIGSVSKQITAVLILRELDKGHLKLDDPIRKYLPELTQGWSDTVTIHHLLTHTHGITQLNKPLSFKPGTQFAYSQLGYHLLASIVESTAKRSFADMSADLFTKCGMKHSFHPGKHLYKSLVNGYTEASDGKIVLEKNSLQNYAAAGGFISSAGDLALWNKNLFEGKLLAAGTLKKMTTKQKNAVRDHPVFGKTAYGYGITIDSANVVQYGQTGFAPGFVSMCFYFPKSKTSLVVLENIAYDSDDLKKTFYYHEQILSIVKENLRLKK